MAITVKYEGTIDESDVIERKITKRDLLGWFENGNVQRKTGESHYLVTRYQLGAETHEHEEEIARYNLVGKALVEDATFTPAKEKKNVSTAISAAATASIAAIAAKHGIEVTK